MRIALDATYSVGAELSGIGIYSRELLRSLPALFPDDHFTACLRWKQWLRRESANHLPNLETRLLQWPFAVGRANVFHALNQRADWRPAPAVVTTFHDLFVMTADYSTAAFRARFTEQARRAAERSDLIIAVSNFTASQVNEYLQVDRSRIRVIYHGVHRLSLELPGGAPEPVILFVGAIQKRKNLLRLIEAFEQTGPEWRLVLAGSPNGYGAEAIHERIARSPRRSSIEVIGYVDNRRLQELYATASIFAFPSLDEGFGIPILEAMLHGVPVVTSNRSGTAEVAGDAALLVNPENVEELASALRRLAEDQPLRQLLIKKGRERASEFSWSRAARATYQAYEEAVAGSVSEFRL